MLNIISHQGNINQNHNEVLLHITWGYHNNNKWKLSVGKEELELSYIAGRNATWFNHYGNQFGNSQKVKHRLTLWPNNWTSRCTPKKKRNICTKISSLVRMLIAALFVAIRRWKQSKYSSTDKWINKLWLTTYISRTSLLVQWLRFHTSIVGVQVQSLFGKLRSHMPCNMAEK